MSMSKISAVLGFCLAAFLPAMAFAQGAASPVVVTNSTGSPVNTVVTQGGTAATVSLDGGLNVNTPPSPQFADTFSTALDTVTNWTAKNSTGTAATASGTLVVNSSTTASAWGGVASQQSYLPVGVGSQTWGVLASFTVLAQANSVRVWGMFTVPATPTTAVPVTDGYIYRLDGTGALFAEIWSAGVAVSSTNVTASCLPLATVPAIFAISYRTSLVQFICGTSTASPVAVIPGINPANQSLNVSALSIAGSTPPVASAVLTLGAIALAAGAPGSIKSGLLVPTINDPALVINASPNVIDPCSSPNIAKSSVPISIATATTTSLVAASGTTTVYVCGFSLTIAPSATAADTVLFESGTGAACVTTQAALTGTFGNGDLTSATGVTPISYGGHGLTIFKTPASGVLCALTAGTAVSVQGVLTYVQQ